MIIGYRERKRETYTGTERHIHTDTDRQTRTHTQSHTHTHTHTITHTHTGRAGVTRAQVAALAVEAIFTEAAKNRVVEVVNYPAKTGKSKTHAAAAAAGEDSGEGVSAWGALFARHRAGIGAYMSQKDQMR